MSATGLLPHQLAFLQAILGPYILDEPRVLVRDCDLDPELSGAGKRDLLLTIVEPVRRHRMRRVYQLLMRNEDGARVGELLNVGVLSSSGNVLRSTSKVIQEVRIAA